jgi:subtilisin family serine protease
MQHPGRVVVRTARFESFEERLALTAQPWSYLLPMTGTLGAGDEQSLPRVQGPNPEANPDTSHANELPSRTYSSVLPEPLPLSTGASVSAARSAQQENSRDGAGPHFGLDGTGQTVAIIDSGIAYDHPALGSGLGKPYQVVGGWDFAEQDADPYDDAPFGFHGTHVAGIVASQAATARGVAPGVDLVALRVFDDQGMGKWEWVEQSLQWVEAHRNDFAHPITTINLSVGSLPSHPSTSQWQILEDEFQRLHASGVLIVVAAGNGFADQPVAGLNLPAASRWVVPVASVDPQGQLSPFSQRQADILAAPGERVLSTVPDYLLGRDGDRNDFDRASGTSMAAPFVAGASVLVRQAMERNGIQSITPELIQQHLQASAVPRQDRQTGIRYYELDLDKALQRLVIPSNPASVSAPASNAATWVSSLVEDGPASLPSRLLSESTATVSTATSPGAAASSKIHGMVGPVATPTGLLPATTLIQIGPIKESDTPATGPTRMLGKLLATSQVTGSLDLPNERDTFLFTADQDGLVTIEPLAPRTTDWKLGQVGSTLAPANSALRLAVRGGRDYVITFESGMPLGTYDLQFRVEPSSSVLDLGTQSSWGQTKVKAGSAWYRLTAAHTALLTVSAASASDVELQLYDANLKRLAQHTQRNAARVEIAAKAGRSYYIRVASPANRYDLTITNAVSRESGVTTIRGSQANDLIEIDQTSRSSIRVNGTLYTLPLSRQINIQASAGTDRVRVVQPGKSSYQFREVEVLEEVEALAYHLSRDLQLKSVQVALQNSGGWNERWVVDAQGKQYFITSDGSLYRWNGEQDLAKSDLLARLDKRYYKNIEHFIQAPIPPRLLAAEAANWAAHWRLQRFASDHQNWGGQQERWLRGANQSLVFIKPDGGLYLWSGRRDLQGSTLLTQLDVSYYQNLQQLVSTTNSADEIDRISSLLSSLHLETRQSQIDDRLGWNERWLLAADGRHFFISPSGALYQAQPDTRSIETITFVASLGSYFHRYSERLLQLTESSRNVTVLAVGPPESVNGPRDPVSTVPEVRFASLNRGSDARRFVPPGVHERFLFAEEAGFSAGGVSNLGQPIRSLSTVSPRREPQNASEVDALIDLVAFIRDGRMDAIESSENLENAFHDAFNDPLLDALAVIRCQAERGAKVNDAESHPRRP